MLTYCLKRADDFGFDGSTVTLNVTDKEKSEKLSDYITVNDKEVTITAKAIDLANIKQDNVLKLETDSDTIR